MSRKDDKKNEELLFSLVMQEYAKTQGQQHAAEQDTQGNGETPSPEAFVQFNRVMDSAFARKNRFVFLQSFVKPMRVAAVVLTTLVLTFGMLAIFFAPVREQTLSFLSRIQEEQNPDYTVVSPTPSELPAETPSPTDSLLPHERSDGKGLCYDSRRDYWHTEELISSVAVPGHPLSAGVDCEVTRETYLHIETCFECGTVLSEEIQMECRETHANPFCGYCPVHRINSNCRDPN